MATRYSSDILSTRAGATPAKQAGLGLGVFSIALGAAELIATRKLARTLGVDHRTGRTTLRLFGAREVMAGAGLLAAPAHSALMWNRVAGDMMDLTALGLAARHGGRKGAIAKATAFVIGAALIDVWVARALDRSTGKTLPSRAAGPSAPPTGEESTGGVCPSDPA